MLLSFVAAALTFVLINRLQPKTRHELIIARQNVIHVDFKAKRKVS